MARSSGVCWSATAQILARTGGYDEDLQFVISDMREDGGETVSLIPDPESADVPLPGSWADLPQPDRCGA